MYFGIGVVWHEVCESVDEVDEAVVEDEVVDVLDDELSSAQESSRLFMIRWFLKGRSQEARGAKIEDAICTAKQASKRNSKIEGLPTGAGSSGGGVNGGEVVKKRPFHGAHRRTDHLLALTRLVQTRTLY